MATKLTANSFLAVVEQSGLIEQDRLARLLEELKQNGVDLDDSQAIAEALVGRRTLTRWQADKLLQGKHKGFLLGKYRLLALLGKGGMSSVYLAEHVLMRRRCAIKVLPAKRVHDTSYLGRFHREAQAVASLDHPNIVRAYDVDKQVDNGNEVHFLVMEYVDGQSLHDLVLAHGTLAYDKAADYIRQAAEGLAHAHAVGMVHRDIKPGNLLVDRSGVVKILDLGLARFFEEKEEFSLTVAHEEKVLGTADYLAPEQALDSHKVDARADIYSLGCTFYFLLTGHPPFTDGTLAQRLLSHQTKEPPPIQNDRPDAPPSLVEIVNRMMVKEANRRVQTAKEVASQLAAWLAENAGEEWKQSHPSATNVGAEISSDLFRIPPPSAPDTDGAQGAATSLDLPETPDEIPLKPLDDADDDSVLSGTSLKPKKESRSKDEADSANVKLEPDEAAESDATSEKAKPTESPPRKKPGGDSDVKPSQIAAGDSGHAGAPPKRKSPSSVIRGGRRSGSAVRRAGQSAPRESAEATGDVPEKRTRPPDTKTKLPRKPDSSISRQRATESDDEIAFAIPVAPSKPGMAHAPRKPETSSHPGSSAACAKVKRERDTNPAVRIAITAAVATVLFGGIAVGIYRYLAPETGEFSNGGRAARQRTTDAARNRFPRQITVGPQGDYTTINAALEAAKKGYRWSGGEDRLKISVKGGQTYPESLVFDNSGSLTELWPRGIQLVVEGSIKAVLAPPGSDPIITLKDIESLTIDGFELQADGRDIAVEMSGYLIGTSLRGMMIQGFSKTGVHGSGPVGFSGARSEEVLLERIQFRAGNPNAVAIRLEAATSDPAQVRIDRCAFIGPMAAGIQVGSDIRSLQVRQSAFFELQKGIEFSGSRLVLGEVRVENNTFHTTDVAIEFDRMPAEGSHNLRFQRNLFDNVGTVEAIVRRNYDEDAFFEMLAGGAGLERNWSNRPAPASPMPGEVDLFREGGTRGGETRLYLDDPAARNFLLPKAGAAHQMVGARMMR